MYIIIVVVVIIIMIAVGGSGGGGGGTGLFCAQHPYHEQPCTATSVNMLQRTLSHAGGALTHLGGSVRAGLGRALPLTGAANVVGKAATALRNGSEGYLDDDSYGDRKLPVGHRVNGAVLGWGADRLSSVQNALHNESGYGYRLEDERQEAEIRRAVNGRGVGSEYI